jgi:uncharacterized protein
MQTPDVNILINAHREESPEHEHCASWMAALAAGPEPFCLAEPVMQSFVRIVTNRRVFIPPSTTVQAFAFLDQFTRRPHCTVIRPGPNHWDIFRQLCEGGNIAGKLVADAAHAALAIEYGCEWVTADTDFARFAPLLRWRHL